jgi:TPP-dependent pyruvate/acetoin dehydrogenase alpha subunit
MRAIELLLLARVSFSRRFMPQKSKRVKNPGIALLNSRKLKQLYSSMLKCRMVQKQVRGVSRAFGQEATEVGATIDLLRDDFIAPSGREFVFSFMRGEPLQSVFAQLRAIETGTPSCVLSLAGPAAERLSMATGTALACQWQKQSRVVLAFAVEDRTGEIFPHHVLEFASRHKLPIVYLIQHRLKARSAKRMRDYGMPSIKVAGNDVVAVYRVTQEAVRRAREGHGPALIHCQSFGADDPLKFMENYLKQKRLWSDSWKQKIATAFNRELDRAVAAANRTR